jgi:nucleotide-binding universal stress UspA family protein
VNVVGTVLRRGDAATEILAYAQEQKVDLIVAGSRGLSGVSGWWLGSVSRKLVHYAPCSVLIVRGEPPDAEV